MKKQLSLEWKMKWSNDSHNSQEIFFCSDRLFTQSVKCAPTQQRSWNTLHLVEHIHLDTSFQYITKKKKQCYFLFTHTHRPGATWTCSRCEFWRARRVNHTKNNTLKHSAILHTQTSHKVYILQDILTLFARNLYSRSTLRGWITMICTWLFMIQVPPRHICSQGIVSS